MDRRTFLTTSGLAVAGATLIPSELFAQGTSGDAAANALFERIFQEAVARSPELATSLGLDRGALAGLKSKLSPRTAQEREDDLAQVRKALAELGRLDRASLSPANRLNLDVITYSLEAQTVAPARYGIDSVVRPYPIFQQGGAYFRTPDFLNTAHTIRSTEGAEAYLARLDAFARILDEETAEQRAQAARGFLAPDWSLDLTLGQMRKLRGEAAANSTLVQSLVRRTKAANIAGDWQGRATRIVANNVYPALDRQIAAIEALKPTTRPGDGAWRLTNGDAIYAAALEQMTTTKLTPEEVHQMGLAQVAEISAELDKILRGEGLTQGSVGARLDQLNRRSDQLYPNTDEGRAALLASLNDDVQRMTEKLPQFFSTLPKQPLEIRRVPVEIQDGASNGYYNRAALDGSRPAIYFINLKDTGDWPKYTLPALSFHEGVPGHHLQISISQTSAEIPTLRKVGGFSPYSEGWALYAESLADEAGVYRGPIERAGFLQSYLFRATRLVVDTGLHAKRWSREKATDYMVETTGFARPRTQREVERYCTQIGQACSYKVGHGVWSKLRKEAEAKLGPKFDVKRFHDVLLEGAMPLTILEQRVRERMNEVA
ncbi:DUF885 family protein [Sphingomonas sp. MAH-20]|uniref:DUF885 family protein n=1 Tax=Sphingomonas horti TaxID=2682842 RepID=A0A6I4J3U8_9SPHN|nr:MULTISPECIES: DUF885 family protein [Sphingomonas]MBA2921191.1 DUF885 family protein [Sphingomonas sp. CGMCC 1.13658]MVO79432.1 DUF885 family protein [Sphingomonas horti]